MWSSVAFASASSIALSEKMLVPAWTIGESWRIAVIIGGFIPPIIWFRTRLVAVAAAVAVARAFVSSREVISPAKDVILARKAFAWGRVVFSFHD
jgi:hypothetical protein